jgi:hypothetical protein
MDDRQGPHFLETFDVAKADTGREPIASIALATVYRHTFAAYIEADI